MEGVLGQYRIVKKLGEGGMGAVYLAEHALLGRRAAVKVLHPTLSASQDIVQRFFNEARAATAIADPGIVQIFDFGYHTDGSAYIVMEFLEGEPLDARLRRFGRLAPEDALRLLRQVASSLHAAHTRGIIHRDLKPENIFLVADREVAGGERAKILDFGIAKLTNSAEAKVKTQTSAIMGTPLYMSPEQCRGAGHVDHRSDLYALGCVLYHLVVGRVPFDGEGVGEIIAAHMMTAPPIPSQQAPGIPPAVDALILRLLSKSPDDRFASAGELAEACDALLGGGLHRALSYPPGSPSLAPQVTGGITGGPSLTTLSGAAGAAPAAGTMAPVVAKKRGPLIAIGAVGAVAAVVIAVVVASSGGGTGSPSAAAAPTAPTPAPAAVTPPPAPPPAPTPVVDDAAAARERASAAAYDQFVAAAGHKDYAAAVAAFASLPSDSAYKAKARDAFDGLRSQYLADTLLAAKRLAKARKCDDLDALATQAAAVFADVGLAVQSVECKGSSGHHGTTASTTPPGPGSSTTTTPTVTKPTDPSTTKPHVPGDLDGDGIPDVR